MPGTIFVTGGSGFVGSAVINALVSRGYHVHALVNRRPVPDRDGRVKSFPGGLFSPRALDAAMAGCNAAIHLVGIIMERPADDVTFERIHLGGTRSVVSAAVRNNVRRYVHMSALGTRPDAVSTYHKTKYAAEEYVRDSGLQWTIFRPSMIHGEHGEFMRMEAKWARRKAPPFLFMPYFGAGPLGRGGAGMLQPVYVDDVARAFVDALERPRTIGEVYLLGGNQRITWPQMHKTVSRAVVGKERWVVPMPAWKANALTRVIPAPLLPFNRDQVVMSQEDNTCDVTKVKEDFGWEPRGFDETLPEYASKL